jgi:hypothetical protein
MVLKYIRSLRTEACNVLQDDFVLRDNTPIWTKVKKVNDPDPVAYYRNQLKLKNEKNICKQNCTPISIAALKKIKNDFPNLQVRVVVGKMLNIGIKLNKEDLNNKKTTLLGWNKFTDFGDDYFHTWIEVSNDNFTNKKVIDLTYSFPNESYGCFDNYSSVHAKRNNLIHIPILVEEKDVKSFFYNLLSTQIREKNEFDKCFETAIQYF